MSRCLLSRTRVQNFWFGWRSRSLGFEVLAVKSHGVGIRDWTAESSLVLPGTLDRTRIWVFGFWWWIKGLGLKSWLTNTRVVGFSFGWWHHGLGSKLWANQNSGFGSMAWDCGIRGLGLRGWLGGTTILGFGIGLLSHG